VEKEKKLNCPLCGKQTTGFKIGNQYILGNHVRVKGNAKISGNTKIIGDIEVGSKKIMTKQDLKMATNKE
jgi:UDP-3-O-[3-hydroxymyristoyl] glucosamine N-acyltransferase